MHGHERVMRLLHEVPSGADPRSLHVTAASGDQASTIAVVRLRLQPRPMALLRLLPPRLRGQLSHHPRVLFPFPLQLQGLRQPSLSRLRCPKSLLSLPRLPLLIPPPRLRRVLVQH